ncbi:protein arginine kinase [bacterium]|nr:protein arginine kinase [bacterium]
MSVAKLVGQIAGWLQKEGPLSDIVISSRVRLARNYDMIPFPHRANREQLKEVILKTEKAIDGSKYLKNVLIIDMSELTDMDIQFLVEKHLISREFGKSRAEQMLAVSDKEIISIMVNEEDHLRLQCIQSGLQLLDSWRLINQATLELESQVEFAFSKKLGYLTSCPTNVGTGMRASVLIHLPALVITKQIGKVLQAVAKLGIAIRGLYGEGTEAYGNFFQISNQVTLGYSEEDIINNIECVVKQVVGYEENARTLMIKEDKKAIEDKIWRAYGVLSNVRIIDFQETLNLLSLLRLGIGLKMIDKIDRILVNKMFIITQPAYLQKLEGKKLVPHERDIVRASLIRENLERKGTNKDV